MMILSRKLLMRYRELKQEVPDCLLLMQVGAFMQVMDEDARTVSQVTGLKLQMAGEVDDPVPQRERHNPTPMRRRVFQRDAGCADHDKAVSSLLAFLSHWEKARVRGKSCVSGEYVINQ